MNKKPYTRYAFSALVGAILLLVAPHAFAGSVTGATGGGAILTSTATNACTPSWTSLSGPIYTETVNGDLNNGTVILTAPTGFEFNPAATVSVVLTTGNSNVNTNTNNVAVGGTVATSTIATGNYSLTVTATSITFNIFSKSQGNTLNTIQWQGIQVRPTDVSATAIGNIMASGTAGVQTVANTTNFGTLTEVAGAATKLVITLPGQTFAACIGNSGTVTSQTAGGAFSIARITATDANFNVVTSYTGTKTLSYTGPATGCVVAPSYTTSVNFSNGVSTTTLVTTLVKAETTTITASDGSITSLASASLLVNPGILSKLVVTLPGQTFTACAGNSGTVTNQATGVSFNIASITATDSNLNIVTTYGGTKTVSYSGPGGSPSYTSSVTFSAGQSTTTLVTTLTAAETTTITVAQGTTSGPASSPLTVIATVASFNAFETSTAAGATSGVIKTKVSGSTFSLDVVALTAAPAVSIGFTGNVKVELLDSSGAGSCSSGWPVIQTLAMQTFTAGEQGRHSVSAITEANAWKNVRIRISYPTTSPTIVNCSSDNFAIRPNTLILAVTDLDWQTAGTTRTLNNTAVPGGTVHKAGQPFTIKATAQNSAAATTGNYAGSPIAMLSQCTTAGGVCPASSGILSTGSWTANSGTLTTSTAIYGDVGAFSVILQDQTFAAVDAGDSTASERYINSVVTTVGRFVPDHFVVTAGTITPRTDIAACAASSFTYMDEPFSITFDLTAQNTSNGTTSNYAGTLATLVATNPSHLNFAAVDTANTTNVTAAISAITLANPGKVTTNTTHGFVTGSKVYISGVAGMSGVNNALYTVTVIDVTNFTIAANTAGFGTYISGGTASRLSTTSASGSWIGGTVNITSTIVLQRSGQPDGPFNTLMIGVTPQDLDGVQVSTGAFNVDADKNTVNERVNLGTAQFRFGRLALSNAYGSELLNLPIPMQTQYWNGNFFLTNPQDNCTAISSVGNVLFGNYQGGISGVNMMSPGNVTLAGAFTAGIGSLVLTKPLPQPTQKGSVDITLDLVAENKTYLQGKGSGSNFDQNPTVRGTFGIYKQGPVIYMREIY